LRERHRLGALDAQPLRLRIDRHGVARQVVQQVHGEQVVVILVGALVVAEVERDRRRKAVRQAAEGDGLFVVGIDPRRGRVLAIEHRIHAVAARIELAHELHRHFRRRVRVEVSRGLACREAGRAVHAHAGIAGSEQERGADGLRAVQVRVAVAHFAAMVLRIARAGMVVLVDAREIGGDGVPLRLGHAEHAHARDRALVDLAEVEPERGLVAEGRARAIEILLLRDAQHEVGRVEVARMLRRAIGVEVGRVDGVIARQLAAQRDGQVARGAALRGAEADQQLHVGAFCVQRIHDGVEVAGLRPARCREIRRHRRMRGEERRRGQRAPLHQRRPPRPPPPPPRGIAAGRGDGIGREEEGVEGFASALGGVAIGCEGVAPACPGGFAIGCSGRGCPASPGGRTIGCSGCGGPTSPG
jgi:hypothetical protein